MLTATCVPAAVFASPILVNGGFEDYNVGSLQTVGPITAPGWTKGGASAFPYVVRDTACGGAYAGAFAGCQYAILGGVEDSGVSWLEQTLSGFTVGSTYDLTWMQASEWDWQFGEFNPSTVEATILGAVTQSLDFTSPGNTLVQYWGNWVPMTYTFVADAATLTFRFSSDELNSAGQRQLDPGIDEVVLREVGPSEVPEPASLTLFVAGLAVLGARRVRRRV